MSHEIVFLLSLLLPPTPLRDTYLQNINHDGTVNNQLATDVWIPVKALEDKQSLPVVFHQAR